LLFGLGFFHAVINKKRNRELLLEYLRGKHECFEDEQIDQDPIEGQENELDQDEDELDGNTQERNEKTKNKRRKKLVILDFDDETSPYISMITIHFKALIYIMGEISYFGRVTDVWDM
ncbi:MAG: hypothetical protein EZS28_055027, partial [Streblomastix strix]